MANDNDIFEITNCLSKCDKNEYTSKPIGGFTTYPNDDPRVNNTLRIQFYYSSVDYEIREQVY